MSTPPTPPRRTPPVKPASSSNGKRPPNELRIDSLGINATPPKKKKKKKLVPLIDKIYFVMFIVGMIIGAFLSLLLPYRDHTIHVAGRTIAIPLNIVKLQLWQRFVVYAVMVIANGFLWSKLAREICATYYPQTRFIHKKREEEVEEGQKLWRLDE